MAPKTDKTVASSRNCKRMNRREAPMALRMPISRVRSVTDTNMMFVIPIPPTSRLIAPTAPSRAVNTPSAVFAVSNRLA